MVGAGVLNIPTLGDGAVILRATLGVVEVFTLCVDVSPTLCVDDVCTAIEGAPGFQIIVFANVERLDFL